MIAHRAEIIAEIERRRQSLSLSLLRIFNYYRALVGFALLSIFLQGAFATKLGSLNADLFLWTCVGYTLVNLLSAALIHVLPKSWLNRQRLRVVLVLYDIATLALLMYFSGGIASGLAALILITVATGSIIVTGRIALFIAASATIALLYEEFYLAISVAGAQYDFFQAGVFGAIYFAAALSIQRLSIRIRENDIRALTQAAELADLERLNKQIIQRLRTGIIVIDKDDQIRMYNQSARTLCGRPNHSDLDSLPENLLQALTQWRSNTSHRSTPFQVGAQLPEIRANFSALHSSDPDGDVTIYLEDTVEVQQQAQQLKLAELGRLSASIAHEIRNPLGAISHAAQLLNESEDLQPADQRLTDIIINHCSRMNGVVENVLEMSRRRVPQPQRITLQEHLAEFLQQSSSAFPDAQLSISVEPSETVIRVDPAHLNQAITNLVDNAIRYSNDNDAGPIAHLEGGIDSNSERPYLNVIDYGAGVDPGQVSSLFQPFNTTATTGTGLGLYISKELCEANQAQLTYFKHEAGGSCFRILFAHPDRISS
ncbi:MAG: PAS domain-containing protein [Gammaproteobacteria bacterium]|nr:PAS domain-containing protein [Gammaproteobacteria bacterium]